VNATEARPELLPVLASVFDDDFFRKPNEELRATGLQSAWPEPAQGRAVAPSYGIQEEAKSSQWPESKVSAFAGHAAESVPATDELDIPAFLRRSH